jgi:hypothetical protein
VSPGGLGTFVFTPLQTGALERDAGTKYSTFTKRWLVREGLDVQVEEGVDSGAPAPTAFSPLRSRPGRHDARHGAQSLLARALGDLEGLRSSRSRHGLVTSTSKRGPAPADTRTASERSPQI